MVRMGQIHGRHCRKPKTQIQPKSIRPRNKSRNKRIIRIPYTFMAQHKKGSQMNTIETILALEAIDKQVIAIRRGQLAKPKALEILIQEGHAQQHKVNTQTICINNLKVKIETAEVQAKSFDEELQSTKNKLRICRKQDEFTAIGTELHNLEAQKHIHIKEAIALMEQLEQAEAALPALQEQNDTIKTAQEELANEIQNEKNNVKEDLAKLKEQRTTAREAVDALHYNMLQLYDRAIRGGKGRATAPLKNNICQGCYCIPRPNIIIKSNMGPTQCEVCARFLIPEPKETTDAERTTEPTS
jgi:predicted  nucleic acid-binding Zn-ribbon protein